MKAKWKISPIPQSPNPNQRPQLRSGLFSSSCENRWPRSAIGLWDKTNARFRCRKATPAGFPLPPGTPGKETQFPLCEPGDRAMWIVMYVAMIASLSAMGMLPVAEYRHQLPHDDA